MPKERRIHWHLLWARRTRLDRRDRGALSRDQPVISP